MIDHGDTAFMMVCAALVFIMTPGVAFFYGGLVNKKNVLTIMMQSFISMGVVTIIWFIFGFSMAFGPDIGGIIGGAKYCFLNAVGMDPNPAYSKTIPFFTYFSYQEMFAILTPALITGAFADRVNFKSYLVFLVFWSILIYAPLCHWVWGGGFLGQLGVVDFAGGIVVHASAGMAALASVFFVGKRHVQSKDERHSCSTGNRPPVVRLVRIQRRRRSGRKRPGRYRVCQYRSRRILRHDLLADHFLDQGWKAQFRRSHDRRSGRTCHSNSGSGLHQALVSSHRRSRCWYRMLLCGSV